MSETPDHSTTIGALHRRYPGTLFLEDGGGEWNFTRWYVMCGFRGEEPVTFREVTAGDPREVTAVEITETDEFGDEQYLGQIILTYPPPAE